MRCRCCCCSRRGEKTLASGGIIIIIVSSSFFFFFFLRFSLFFLFTCGFSTVGMPRDATLKSGFSSPTLFFLSLPRKDRRAASPENADRKRGSSHFFPFPQWLERSNSADISSFSFFFCFFTNNKVKYCTGKMETKYPFLASFFSFTRRMNKDCFFRWENTFYREQEEET